MHVVLEHLSKIHFYNFQKKFQNLLFLLNFITMNSSTNPCWFQWVNKSSQVDRFNATICITICRQSGKNHTQIISNMTGPVPLLKRVNITILRHKHNYFKDLSTEQLNDMNIPESARPISPPLTHEMYQTHIRKNEIWRNKRFDFCIASAIAENAPVQV